MNFQQKFDDIFLSFAQFPDTECLVDSSSFTTFSYSIESGMNNTIIIPSSIFTNSYFYQHEIEDGDGKNNLHDFDSDGDLLSDGWNDTNANGIYDEGEGYGELGDPLAGNAGGYGTDPADTDSDGDGLTDGFEINKFGAWNQTIDPDGDEFNFWNALGPNLWAEDEDGDFLINIIDWDSDNDGLPDGWFDENNDQIWDDNESFGEIGDINNNNNGSYGTDPLDNDTDKDGILDGMEIHLNMDPLVRYDNDMDNDGIWDSNDLQPATSWENITFNDYYIPTGELLIKEWQNVYWGHTYYDDATPPASTVKSLLNEYLSFEWKVSYDVTPPSEWIIKSDFNDSLWEKNITPIGNGDTPKTPATKRDFEDLYARKTFVLDKPIMSAYLRLSSDDGADIWVNGVKVLNSITDHHPASYWDYQINITNELKIGENFIAIHIKDYGGSCYFEPILEVQYTYGFYGNILNPWKAIDAEPEYSVGWKLYDGTDWKFYYIPFIKTYQNILPIHTDYKEAKFFLSMAPNTQQKITVQFSLDPSYDTSYYNDSTSYKLPGFIFTLYKNDSWHTKLFSKTVAGNELNNHSFQCDFIIPPENITTNRTLLSIIPVWMETDKKASPLDPSHMKIGAFRMVVLVNQYFVIFKKGENETAIMNQIPEDVYDRNSGYLSGTNIYVFNTADNSTVIYNEFKNVAETGGADAVVVTSDYSDKIPNAIKSVDWNYIWKLEDANTLANLQSIWEQYTEILINFYYIKQYSELTGLKLIKPRIILGSGLGATTLLENENFVLLEKTPSATSSTGFNYNLKYYGQKLNSGQELTNFVQTYFGMDKQYIGESNGWYTFKSVTGDGSVVRVCDTSIYTHSSTNLDEIKTNKLVELDTKHETMMKSLKVISGTAILVTSAIGFIEAYKEGDTAGMVAYSTSGGVLLTGLYFEDAWIIRDGSFVLKPIWAIASIVAGSIFASYYLYQASLTDDPALKHYYYGRATSAFIDGVMFSNPFTALGEAAVILGTAVGWALGLLDRPMTFGDVVVAICDWITGTPQPDPEKQYFYYVVWKTFTDNIPDGAIYVGDYP